MKISPNAFLLGLGIGFAALWALRLAGRKTVEIASTKLNPASSENIVYKDVIGGIGRTVSGDDNWSLGVWLWEVTHPEQVQAERDLFGR